jgi:serine protease AprX
MIPYPSSRKRFFQQSLSQTAKPNLVLQKFMATISINGITIDPLTPPRAPAAMAMLAAMSPNNASSFDYILVQTTHALNQEEKQSLEAAGASILEYVPEDTYLCHFPPNDLGKVRQLSFVSWTGPYDKGFKMRPALIGLEHKEGGHSLFEVNVRPRATLDATQKLVDVVLHRNVKASDVLEKIAEAAHVSPQLIQIGRNKVRLMVKARRLDDLASVDVVRTVEEVQPRKLLNNIARQILGVPTGGAVGPAITGEGQVVAIADTGFDQGSTIDTHPAFTGRVLKLYSLGRSGDASDPDGHGTHVCGSVLGDGKSDKLGISIQGTAPAAKLVLQSVLDSQGGLGGLPIDLNELFADPYNNDGARIHSNSWGSVVGNGLYDSQASEVDDFVWNHRDLLICFAAGNEGKDSNARGVIDVGSLTPPGTAKNCLTVGASESLRPTFQLTYGQGFGYPANPIAADLAADNAEGMAAFSSRGLTQDRRCKPDVVAPGTAILSTRSRLATSTGWQLSQDPLYFFDGGTSMATPLVAGCVAIVRESLAKVHGVNNPSAALLKALIINGAHSMTGQYVPSEVGAIPDTSEGFGRVNIGEVISPKGVVQFWDEGTKLDTGEDETRTVKIATAGQALKATLVWTDPAGAGLQNDLDLIIHAADGTERHGNVPAGSPDFDRVNNVEQVIWSNVPQGELKIITRANRITQATQSYALVVRVG